MSSRPRPDRPGAKMCPDMYVKLWCAVRCARCEVVDAGNIEHHQPHRSAASAPPAPAATRLIDSPEPDTNHTRCVLSFFIKSATDRDGRAMWWQPTLIFEDTRSGHRDGSGMVTQQHLF